MVELRSALVLAVVDGCADAQGAGSDGDEWPLFAELTGLSEDEMHAMAAAFSEDHTGLGVDEGRWNG